MTRSQVILNFAAGACGILSGLLWGLAATSTPTPPIGSYYGVVDSPNSQFAVKWRRSTRLNQWAACMTGLSAFLFGLSALLAR